MKKEYTLHIYVENGKISVSRINKGFNSMEVLGILTNAVNEVQDMIAGNTKPDVTKASVIKDTMPDITSLDLKKLRLHGGHTLKDVSLNTGISVSVISRLENNKNENRQPKYNDVMTLFNYYNK